MADDRPWSALDAALIPRAHRYTAHPLRPSPSPGDLVAELLDDQCFAIVALSSSIRASTFLHAAQRVKANERDVADQVARGAKLPRHHRTAAVEQSLPSVRPRVERRALTFRNRRRMSLVFGPVRLQRLRVDELDHYTTFLCEAARAAGGRIEYQRQGYCTGRYYDLRP